VSRVTSTIKATRLKAPAVFEPSPSHEDVQRFPGLYRNHRMNTTAATAERVARQSCTRSSPRNDADLCHAGWHFERLPRTRVIKRFMVRKTIGGTARRHDAVTRAASAPGEHCRSHAAVKRAAE
jgi:hypothetical protein